MTTLLVTDHNTLITLTNALYMQVVEALYKMPQDLAHASRLRVQYIQVGGVHRVCVGCRQLNGIYNGQCIYANIHILIPKIKPATISFEFGVVVEVELDVVIPRRRGWLCECTGPRCHIKRTQIKCTHCC